MKSQPPIVGNGSGKNVGIWIRVSTEDQAKGESPDHHLERGKAYAKAKGWNVKEIYDLAGVSGKSVKDHPEAKRMLADIGRNHISGLVFSKLARLARNTRELLEFAEQFNKHHADLVSLQETIDTSTPSGRLFFTMIAAMAQWEREEIADRVTASISVRARLGKPLGGPAPYGYQWIEKKLVLDSQESPIRKRIYELFLEQRRKGAVARTLNESGYRTRQGSKWSDIAIGRLLRCPSAKGVYYLNRTRQLGDWKWEAKPESEWGVIQIEPIVSESLWTQCNQIMEEHTKAHRRPGPRPVQLFAGLTYCDCGQKMYVKQNSPKYVCQKCKNKIPMVDLEAIFQEELEQYFSAPERIAGHLREANSNLKDKECLLEAHSKEMQKLREDMARTHRLYLDGHVTGQGFGDFYKPAEERLNQLVAELPKLEAEIAHMKISSLSAEEVVEEAKQLYSRWPKLPMDNKRKIVESIVEKITIGDRKIDITLSYLPASEVMVTNQQALPARLTQVPQPS